MLSNLSNFKKSYTIVCELEECLKSPEPAMLFTQQKAQRDPYQCNTHAVHDDDNAMIVELELERQSKGLLP